MKMKDIEKAFQLKERLDIEEKHLETINRFYEKGFLNLSNGCYEVEVPDDMAADIIKKVKNNFLKEIEKLKNEIAEL